MSERADSQMELASAPLLVSVVPGPLPALQRGLQGTLLHNGGTWSGTAAFSQTQDRAQIVDYGLE